MTKQITKPGQRVIDQYRKMVSNPAFERHMQPVDGLGQPVPGKWMRVGTNNGAELSAAQKLARDGHATMKGGRHNHWIMVHDCA